MLYLKVKVSTGSLTVLVMSSDTPNVVVKMPKTLEKDHKTLGLKLLVGVKVITISQ
jgi:hypothetical protein